MPSVGRASFLRACSAAGLITGTGMCQCRQSGNPHFYPDGQGRVQRVLDVMSMPSVGQSSFLLPDFKEIFFTGAMCQCPQSGDPHFYEKCSSDQCIDGGIVSMPSVGRSSFLRQELKLNECFENCVNALSRAILISTSQKGGIMAKRHFGCQCPQSGDPHFYPTSLEPAILAAFQGRFCTYFSEYSDN